MVLKVTRFLEEAERAERSAAHCTDETERKAFLHIAKVWRDLAETRARLIDRSEEGSSSG